MGRRPGREPRPPLALALLLTAALLFGTLLLAACGTEEPTEETAATDGADTTEAGTETTEVGEATGVAPTTTSIQQPLIDVPQAVEATRQKLLIFAQNKDYESLAEVATAGEGEFNYSFGEPLGGDPTDYWRRLEESGESPADELERILTLPYAEQDGTFVWPFAHTLEPPFDQEERDQLEEHFSDEEIGEWEQFGAYSGYRTAISSEGEWLYFVAGD